MRSRNQVVANAASNRPVGNHLLLLSLEATSEALLGQVVLDGPLLGSGALGECSGAAKGTGERGVLHADDADVGGATDGAGAGHASGHLNSDGEVHGLGTRETANANARDVLGDLSVLEGSGVLATRGRVDGSGERASAVLVDLVEGHGDGAVILGGGQAGGGSHTGGGLDGGLGGALGGLGATVGGTGQVDAAGQGLLVEGAGSLDLRGVAGSAVHEGGDHGVGIDGATAVGAAESRGLGGADLLGADDGGVGLGAAARGGAVTRSAILDGETGESDAVGTLDVSDDTVGKDVGGSESRNEDGAGVLHFDWLLGGGWAGVLCV